MRDALIDSLIRPPRVVYSGFDWARADKLRPTGAADREKAVQEKFTDRRDERAHA